MQINVSGLMSLVFESLVHIWDGNAQYGLLHFAQSQRSSFHVPCEKLYTRWKWWYWSQISAVGDGSIMVMSRGRGQGSLVLFLYSSWYGMNRLFRY